MSAAIRAQRERRAAPKTIAAELPVTDAPAPPEPPKRLFERLRGKYPSQP